MPTARILAAALRPPIPDPARSSASATLWFVTDRGARAPSRGRSGRAGRRGADPCIAAGRFRGTRIRPRHRGDRRSRSSRAAPFRKRPVLPAASVFTAPLCAHALPSPTVASRGLRRSRATPTPSSITSTFHRSSTCLDGSRQSLAACMLFSIDARARRRNRRRARRDHRIGHTRQPDATVTLVGEGERFVDEDQRSTAHYSFADDSIRQLSAHRSRDRIDRSLRRTQRQLGRGRHGKRRPAQDDRVTRRYAPARAPAAHPVAVTTIDQASRSKPRPNATASIG